MCAGQKGVKGGKWDNCNSIINKIYLKKLGNHFKKLLNSGSNIQKKLLNLQSSVDSLENFPSFDIFCRMPGATF